MKKVAALALLALSTNALAQVYKCVEAGNVVFSDVPCQRSGSKMIDVKPATGGPVNRSSEYWEEKQRREQEARSRAQAEQAREDAEYRKLSAQVEQDRQMQRAAMEAESAARKARLKPSPTASCSPSNPELSDFKKLDGMVIRFDGVRDVATSSLRVSMTAPLMRMNEIKTDAALLDFKADCIKVLKENALIYMALTIEFFQHFSATGTENTVAIKDAAIYHANYRTGRKMYKALEK